MEEQAPVQVRRIVVLKKPQTLAEVELSQMVRGDLVAVDSLEMVLENTVEKVENLGLAVCLEALEPLLVDSEEVAPETGHVVAVVAVATPVVMEVVWLEVVVPTIPEATQVQVQALIVEMAMLSSTNHEHQSA